MDTTDHTAERNAEAAREEYPGPRGHETRWHPHTVAAIVGANAAQIAAWRDANADPDDCDEYGRPYAERSEP